MNCDYAVQKLLEKELVIISGRKEDAAGKHLLYSTSKNFMDYFGINSADDLPKIKEILKQEIVEATKVEKEEMEVENKKLQEAGEKENPGLTANKVEDKEDRNRDLSKTP